jgi:GrpB-like predicted nucleotidyltransferase (UPF0157 family)
MVQRSVKVVPYHPEWVKCYEIEAQKISQIFGDLLVAIHHIGSTSVPGLDAKPIIDILPEVYDIQAVDTLNEGMIGLSYIPKGEAGIPGRRFFIKPSETERTHHVHVFQSGSAEAIRHLAFRDYLIAHPETAAAYADLKRQLAQQFPEDIYGYMDGKDAGIKAVEQEAVEWLKLTGD